MQNKLGSIDDLKNLSKKIRINVLKMVNYGKSSHVASIFSMVEILSVLYGNFLKFRSKEANWEGRDRLILSKGHAGAGIYAVLAEVGFFSKELLKTHYADGSKLSGHVSHVDIDGVEFSTGSLGHGLPVATGVALAGKINKKNYRTIVILSDGECNEGSYWESILFAAHHELKNLIVIIDRNGYQSIKKTEETLKLEPLDKKWESFGWNVENIDGHNFLELLSALENTSKSSRPSCIIANTIKGKGVSFMENNILWHYRSPQGDEFSRALTELDGS